MIALRKETGCKLSNIRRRDRVFFTIYLQKEYVESLIEDNEAIKEGYIYLRYTGVVNGKLMDKNCQWHNLTEYSHLFVGESEIYNNGGSDIWE